MTENQVSLKKRIKEFVTPQEYAIFAWHQLNRVLQFCARDSSLEGAKLVADYGMIEDEQYNDCEELRGLGMGFIYFVVSPNGKIVYKTNKITMN